MLFRYKVVYLPRFYQQKINANLNMKKINYHTHSNYCDGKENLEKYVEQAIKEQFLDLGFSSHAPIDSPNNHFSIPKDKLSQYVDEVRQLANNHANKLNLFVGLECDYVPRLSNDFNQIKADNHLDYIIGGVHLVRPEHSDELWFIDGGKYEVYDEGLQHLFGGDIRKGVKSYFYQLFEMIESQQFDIFAHFDKIKMHNRDRYFTEDEKWYRDYIAQTLDLLRHRDLVVEINTRGIYKGRCPSLYPSPWIIKQLNDLNIPLCISSDAHLPEEIGLLFDKTISLLTDIGVKSLARFTPHGWTSIGIETK